MTRRAELTDFQLASFRSGLEVRTSGASHDSGGRSLSNEWALRTGSALVASRVTSIRPGADWAFSWDCGWVATLVALRAGSAACQATKGIGPSATS